MNLLIRKKYTYFNTIILFRRNNLSNYKEAKETFQWFMSDDWRDIKKTIKWHII